ncbi:hypothetical protein C3432_10700 [Citrobacter amalonaticus]|uniref:Uncharacterized protein n=1 Tax=Citrobacter amalonaticus TaxID=35703 RepID=A0A2S4S0E4_CITAM|nr:hypothetical protein C3432_10700 [Citrobacter amalonaticus]POT76120.1 hypothetical protein C3436_01120 [Citrobacter amalonaticus]POU66880.1 hypothetical protein C3430_08900 [Citrobacter amalonaticus]POV05355.1 hypothetical protein C3424_08425 [Citrobacter amalonaticus]
MPDGADAYPAYTRLSAVGRIRRPASYPALQSNVQETSSWFIRRMNWLGSSSVPRSANSA